MSDERPDEFFSWRSRLGPPDALPEQGLDNRDLTWEKLAARLGKAPGQDSASHASANSVFARLRLTRYRFPAYRIAAACLLLLLIPAARFFHNQPTHITRQPDSTASPKPGTLTARQPSQPVPLRPAEASPVIRSGPTPKELARLRPINNIDKKTRPARTFSDPQPQPAPAAKPQDSLLFQANTAVVPEPALQNTLKSKRLRIVHVNELDNSPNPAPAMTSIPSREPDIRVLILLKNH